MSNHATEIAIATECADEATTMRYAVRTMSDSAPTVELEIGVLPLHADAGYGWHAMFRDRPGDTLATGAGCASVSDCLSDAADSIPDNTRVEIRFRSVAAGTWFAEELQTDPEAVAAEMLRRIRGYVGDF